MTGGRRVLFVCYGNACRSPMAEGFARALGEDVIAAFSAGFAPQRHLPAHTVAVMAEAGIDISGQYSKSIFDVADQPFDLIVNMSGIELPLFGGVPVLNWDVYDPYGGPIEEYRRTRAEVETRVRELVDSLRSPSRAKA